MLPYCIIGSEGSVTRFTLDAVIIGVKTNRKSVERVVYIHTSTYLCKESD